MAGKAPRKLDVLGVTSVEFVRQYRTEDHQIFEHKDVALLNAAGIALTKKLETLRPILQRVLAPDAADITGIARNAAVRLSDSELQLLHSLGDAASVILSSRKDDPKKAST